MSIGEHPSRGASCAGAAFGQPPYAVSPLQLQRKGA